MEGKKGKSLWKDVHLHKAVFNSLKSLDTPLSKIPIKILKFKETIYLPNRAEIDLGTRLDDFSILQLIFNLIIS